MIPLSILAIFGWCYMARKGVLGPREQTRWEQVGSDFLSSFPMGFNAAISQEYVDSADESPDEESTSEDKNMSLAEKFRGLQDKLLELQTTLDFVASSVERIRKYDLTKSGCPTRMRSTPSILAFSLFRNHSYRFWPSLFLREQLSCCISCR